MKDHAHHYQAKVTWDAADGSTTKSYKDYTRDHKVEIPGKPTLPLSADPAFLGNPGLLNPEDCLLTALASCHMLSYLALAALQGVEVIAYEDEASGTMMQSGQGGHFTEVVLRPVVTISAGSGRTLAEELHRQASEACFIAASMNFPVKHEPQIRQQSVG